MIPLRVLEQENRVITELDFIILDFETTGVYPSVDEAVELGAVRVDAQGRIKDRFSRLINPGRPIPAAVSRIHGIYDEMVAQEADIREVMCAFYHFAAGGIWTAHNAGFDGRFLHKYLTRLVCSINEEHNGFREAKNLRDKWFARESNTLEFPFAGYPVLDTVSLARRTIPFLKSYSLTNLKREWRIPSQRSHRGLDDALAAAQVLQKSISSLGGKQKGLRFLHLWQQASESYVLARHKGGDLRHKKLHDYLQTATSKNWVLEIAYQDKQGERTRRRIQPLRLFYNYTEPYVEAYCHLRRAKRVFRLDRIELSKAYS